MWNTTRTLKPLLAALGLGFITILSSGAAEHPKPKTLDCTLCHSCPEPTKENPCLVAIPQPATDEVSSATPTPDIVILNELEDLYVPVRFNHLAHAKMAEFSDQCQVCHHYQEKGQAIQSCKSCHPKDVVHEDLSQPGLKGAYHRQCLGCHTAWDSETECATCHEKKAEGKLHGTATTFNIHTVHKPIVMEELITFSTEYEENDKVPFHHKRHAEMYSQDCTVCHQQQSCAQCHTHSGEIKSTEMHPMGDLKEIDLHDACYKCHENDECEHCHGQDSNYLFSHEKTGWPLKAYHAELNCHECHVNTLHPQKLESHQCATCHVNGWEAEGFDHSKTGVTLDETHVEASCEDCHIDPQNQLKVSCENCHDDKRKYDPKKGFQAEEEK